MDVIGENAIVGQSGGPTTAINATLSGVIRGVRENKRINKLFGAFNGVAGILSGDFCVLDDIVKTEDDLRLLESTPAAALGSCRVKLEDTEICAKIFQFFNRNGIKYFFYIGGNDSMDTVKKLSKYASETHSDVRAIGVPKTIDNDLDGTDHTPGFGSAAKYIATSIQEIVRDAYSYASKSVTLVEIMGRDAGWLTASAALPRLYGGSAPDYTYLPERTFNFGNFLRDINRTFEKKSVVVVAVAEGLRFENGRYVGENSQSGITDIFGHKYLAGTAREIGARVRRELGCKVRDMSLDVTQRCAAHSASMTDINEAISIGKAAVSAACNGLTGKMMTFERPSESPYEIKISHTDISRVANSTRHVPDKYINSDGNNVTDECLKYIAPLIIGEAPSIYENGIPKHFIISRCPHGS